MRDENLLLTVSELRRIEMARGAQNDSW